jgi:hypothetical protein
MDWIERLFHISPDGGNGSLELLFFVVPIGAFLIAVISALWIRRRRQKEGK